jgi:hypothetical protein
MCGATLLAQISSQGYKKQGQEWIVTDVYSVDGKWWVFHLMVANAAYSLNDTDRYSTDAISGDSTLFNPLKMKRICLI